MQQSIKIMTLNCWGPPFAQKIQERFVLIAEKILSYDYDIIVLTEVFYPESIKFLEESLEVKLPHHHNFKSGLFGTGIFIFSKYPLFNPMFLLYNASESYMDVSGDYYSAKGIAFCVIETSNGPIKLVATHLHCKYHNDEFFVIRSCQIHQLSQFIVNISDNKTPLILAGDLNYESWEIGMEYFKAKTMLYDTFEYIVGDKANDYLTYIGFDGEKFAESEKARVDYIFCNKFLKAKESSVCFEDFEKRGILQYSDHIGVQSTLAFERINIEEDNEKALVIFKKLYQKLSIYTNYPETPFFTKLFFTKFLVLTFLVIILPSNSFLERWIFYLNIFIFGITCSTFLGTFLYKKEQSRMLKNCLNEINIDIKRSYFKSSF